jgi:hypothetical protein
MRPLLRITTLLAAAWQGLQLGAAGPAHALPAGPILAAYTSAAKPEVLLAAVDDGVNVLIWSFIVLTGNVTADPAQGGPDPADVAAVVTGLAERQEKNPNGTAVTHLVSYGGWNAPHPETTQTGAQWWAKFELWDKNFTKEVAAAGAGVLWTGFDGVDLDAEGNDDKESPQNQYDTVLLTLLGTFAQAAKAAGYTSTMVPPQSYLDVGTSAFSLSVLHADPWQPDFAYHGRNTYAPLLALYPAAYDLVILQVYEGWSRSNDALKAGALPLWCDSCSKAAPAGYLAQLAARYAMGWAVDFDGVLGLTNQTIVTVPAEKFVLGLANGWAAKKAKKVLYVDGAAYGSAGAAMRGAGYWDAADDQPCGPAPPRKLATALFNRPRPPPAACGPPPPPPPKPPPHTVPPPPSKRNDFPLAIVGFLVAAAAVSAGVVLRGRNRHVGTIGRGVRGDPNEPLYHDVGAATSEW